MNVHANPRRFCPQAQLQAVEQRLALLASQGVQGPSQAVAAGEALNSLQQEVGKLKGRMRGVTNQSSTAASSPPAPPSATFYSPPTPSSAPSLSSGSRPWGSSWGASRKSRASSSSSQRAPASAVPPQRTSPPSSSHTQPSSPTPARPVGSQGDTQSIPGVQHQQWVKAQQGAGEWQGSEEQQGAGDGQGWAGEQVAEEQQGERTEDGAVIVSKRIGRERPRKRERAPEERQVCV